MTYQVVLDILGIRQSSFALTAAVSFSHHLIAPVRPGGGVVSSATVRRLVAAAAITATLMIAAVNGVYAARADPLDPYMPDFSLEHCPGGHGGFGGGNGFFYCDGIRYPDGSYWHEVIGTEAAAGRIECVLDDGSLIPPPAPPGGCAGGVG